MIQRPDSRGYFIGKVWRRRVTRRILPENTILHSKDRRTRCIASLDCRQLWYTDEWKGNAGRQAKTASKIRARKILDSAKQLDSLLFFSSHEYERFLSAIPSTSLVSQVESPFNSVAWILLDLSVRSREPFLARGARGSSLDPRHFSSWPPSREPVFESTWFDGPFFLNWTTY